MKHDRHPYLLMILAAMLLAALLCTGALAEGGETPAYPESAHPYAKNLTGEDENSFWEYTYPGEAGGLIVHFDPRTCIYLWDDYLEITDEKGNVQTVDNSNYSSVAGSFLILGGDSFTLRLVSDDSSFSNEWGFAVTDVQPLTAAQYAEIKNSGFTFISSAITGYTGTESHITIPASLGGMSITAIGDGAFKFNNTIESVVISEGIASIGMQAFYDCGSLKEVTLPRSLKSSGQDAFQSCYSLEKTHVTSIADYLAIDFESGNYGDRDSSPVCAGGHLYIGGSPVTDLVIPEGTTTLPSYIFGFCDQITSVTLPESLESIEQYAFYECTGMEKLNVPSMEAWLGVSLGGAYANPMVEGADLYADGKRITQYAFPEGTTEIRGCHFTGCESLTSVTIPESVTSIGDLAFSGCVNLAGVDLPAKLESIGYRSFAECASLTEINLPVGLKSIDAQAFWWSGLTCVVLPKGLESLGNEAFSSCKSLAEITLPEGGIDSIGYNIFNFCELEKIHVASIADWLAFPDHGEMLNGGEALYMNGELVVDLVIPEGTTSIPEYAFQGMTSLRSVSLPAGLEFVDYCAFEWCENIEKAYVADIADWMGIEFDGLDANPLFFGAALYVGGQKITDLTLPESVTQIKSYAFVGADIASVTAPGVVSVGNSAFCLSRLQSASLPTAADLGYNAFAYCESLESVSLPAVQTIRDYAFDSCTSLTHFTIPASVQTIEYGAFNGCSALEYLIFESGDLPANVNSGAFKKCSFIVCCPAGSAVEAWAVANGYPVVYNDGAQGALMSFVLSADSYVNIGGSMTIVPITYPADAQAAYTWKSSAPDVISVKDGVVTAHKRGTATITAECGDLSASMQVTGAKFAESFTVKLKTPAVLYRQPITCIVETVPADADLDMEVSGLSTIRDLTVNGNEYTFTFSSASGIPDVTFTDKISGREAVTECPIIRDRSEEYRMSMTPDSHILKPGAKAQANAVLISEEYVEDFYRDVTYGNEYFAFSSSDETVATVDAGGAITAHAPGRATVTAAISHLSVSCDVVVFDLKAMEPFTLPASLGAVSQESFEGVAAQYVVIPDGCRSIGPRAFAGSKAAFVSIPDSVTEIAEDAFAGCEKVVFICESENAAAAYAKEAGFAWMLE